MLLVTFPIIDHILEKNLIFISVYYSVIKCVVKSLTIKRKAIKYCAKYGRKKNTYASSSPSSPSFGVPVLGSYDIVSRFNII